MDMRAQDAGGQTALRQTGSVGPREFVVMMAALMAVNAVSIDAMLPVLPEMGATLGVTSDNERQWIVTAYLLGFGGAQLAYGPLADRFGRKIVLLVALALYVAFTAIAAIALTFPLMLMARSLEGVGAAGTRVLAITIIRDFYSGRQMARIMSLTFIVFLAAPVVAPALGEAIASVAPWRWIFGALAVFGLAIIVWLGLRLPESLHPRDRRALSAGAIWQGVRRVLEDRCALGYMIASMLMLGALFGFINSAQQIFSEALQAPETFTRVFALAAGSMAVASLVNARVVGRLGMRRVSHIALIGFIAAAAAHGLVSIAGLETLWTFAALQSLMMFCFGLVGPNFNSLAMQPLGDIAGTGSSLLGFVTTVGGAVIGFYIGQQFAGTTVPLTLGFIACGLGSLVVVAITERGRLFAAGDEMSEA